MQESPLILNGRHIGLLNADQVGDNALLKLQYLCFDQLICCDLDAIIDQHSTGCDEDLDLVDLLLSLKKAAILIDQLELFPLKDLVTRNQTIMGTLNKMGSPAVRAQLRALHREPITSLSGDSLGESPTKEFADALARLICGGSLGESLVKEVDHALARLMTEFHAIQSDVLATKLELFGYIPENLMSFSFDNGFPTFEKTNVIEALYVAFDGIPVPLGLPWNELKDLKDEPVYKQSIVSFRKWVSEIVAGNTPTSVIIQEIKHSYAEMDLLIKREKTQRVLGAAKFVVGNIFGFAEDIIKLRLENLASRPFTVAQTLADACFSRPAYERHPLYFAAKVKQKAERNS